MTKVASDYGYRDGGYRDGSGIHRVVQRLVEKANNDTALAQRLKTLTRKVSSVKSWPHSPAADDRKLLSPWPLPLPRRWCELVNQAQTEAELKAIRLAVQKGQPFGSEGWVRKTAKKLGLESTVRRRGRPSKINPKPQNLSRLSSPFKLPDV